MLFKIVFLYCESRSQTKINTALPAVCLKFILDSFSGSQQSCIPARAWLTTPAISTPNAVMTTPMLLQESCPYLYALAVLTSALPRQDKVTLEQQDRQLEDEKEQEEVETALRKKV
jgi:hypothetical protein